MQRKITISIKPPSRALKLKIKKLCKEEYNIVDEIHQSINGESYLYLNLESKDADA